MKSLKQKPKSLIHNPSKIVKITKNSLASDLGLKAGDILVQINQHNIEDDLDYLYHIQDEQILLKIRRVDGSEALFEIEKEADQDLGIQLEAFKIRACRNHCIFCFVDQQPQGLRKSLYFKDEDYRASFLYGNYITGTDLKEREINRILEQRLHPIYISVHSTDEEARAFMLGRKKIPPILEILHKFAKNRIIMHTQIVVCSGINDGKVLQKTLSDLTSLYPAVCSVAVVPVGLTKHRQGLYLLKPIEKEEAAEILNMLEPFQQKLSKKFSQNVVYAADELYLKANEKIPRVSYYDDYPQLENGVGLLRLFEDEFAECKKAFKTKSAAFNSKKTALITAESAAFMLKIFATKLNQDYNLQLKVIPVKNTFFGETVTVTGLLSGADIIAALKAANCQTAIIPNLIFNPDLSLTLDNLSLDDLRQASGCKIKLAETSAKGFLNAIFKE